MKIYSILYDRPDEKLKPAGALMNMDDARTAAEDYWTVNACGDKREDGEQILIFENDPKPPYFTQHVATYDGVTWTGTR